MPQNDDTEAKKATPLDLDDIDPVAGEADDEEADQISGGRSHRGRKARPPSQR